MQNARDTFYVTVRDRLAALNPSRTTILRGVSRPGVLVVENELATTMLPQDVFCLQWREVVVGSEGALPLVSMKCAIQYVTAGSEGGSGMDRGRALAAMDLELLLALQEDPRSVAKMTYTVTPPAELQTKVFWGDPVFGPVGAQGSTISRVTEVAVLCYQEVGEL